MRTRLQTQLRALEILDEGGGDAELAVRRVRDEVLGRPCRHCERTADLMVDTIRERIGSDAEQAE